MGVPPPPGAVPWNSLQIELWQADTLHSFKAAYTSQFLSYRLWKFCLVIEARLSWKVRVHSVLFYLFSFITFAVADPGEGPEGPVPALIFRRKWGLKGRKKIFGNWAPPYLRAWLTAPPCPPPPLIWRSGSATAFVHKIPNSYKSINGLAFLFFFRITFEVCYITFLVLTGNHG